MKYERARTISWLESQRSNGFFEGYPEGNMDFNGLCDDELMFYYFNWVVDDGRGEN